MARRVVSGTTPGLLADAALVRLAGKFLLWCALMFAMIVWAAARTPLLVGLQTATAAAAATLMNATGVAATRTDLAIGLPGRELFIGPDCTGLTIAALLSAMVLAYPVKLSSKAVGIAAGVGAILLANLVRLVAIAHMYGASDEIFNLAHDFLFQVGMVAVAIAVWTAWLSFARTRER